MAKNIKDVIVLKLCVDAFDIENKNTCAMTVEKPTMCPICHTSFGGDYVSSQFIPTSNSNKGLVYVAYFCSCCSNMFFSKYSKDWNTHGYLLQSFPRKQKDKTFSKHISLLSPNFVKIYNEALQAETEGLTEICGLGYRKSLEFLIKDYLSFQFPDDTNEIEQLPLGKLIKEKIENRNIKILAERCAWLGNDETHYIRKHEDYNVQDLKRFLDSIITYIDSELTVLEALSIGPK